MLAAIAGIILGLAGIYMMEWFIIERAIAKGQDVSQYAPLFYRP